MAAKGDKKRSEVLKKIIRDAHAGVHIDVLKKRFEELVEDVGAEEIPRLEQELVKEGLPQEEIKKLCDVHVEIFKGSLDKKDKTLTKPGHPVHTLQLENEALKKVAEGLGKLIAELGDPPSAENFPTRATALTKALQDMGEIEKHYLKKENQIFPYMEKHGITAPPQVMWAIHDDVRATIKRAREAYLKSDLAAFSAEGKKLIQAILDMIYKEEKIMFPMVLKEFTREEWVEIKKGEAEIGYALIEPPKAGASAKASAPEAASAGKVALEWGELSGGDLNLILKKLPVDCTFVDANDEVQYFSGGEERIFPRSRAIIGRKVQFCHPPKSLHVVNQILDAFKKGEKDEAMFWIRVQGKFIVIGYYAIRDEKGKYRGCLEVSQDITDLRKLEGEKRLLDW